MQTIQHLLQVGKIIVWNYINLNTHFHAVLHI